MDKSPDAFRTISEVAEFLETPAHVLRFWESRFPQIRPVKRAGGRRYYRPADVALLTGIKHLLHEEGMTIRGVQKILREQGVRHVAGLSGQDVPEDDENAETALEAALTANFGTKPDALPQEQAESAQIVALETALRARAKPEPVPEPPAVLLQDPTRHDLGAADGSEPETPEPEVSAPELSDAEIMQADLDFGPSDTPQVQTPQAAPAQAPAEADLLSRLRALPPGSLADHRQATILRNRLAALADRLSAPPPPAPPSARI